MASTLHTRLKWIGVTVLLMFITPFALAAFETYIWDKYVLVPPPIESVTAETFRFEDYASPLGKTRQEMQSVLEHLFPDGTPRAVVEHVLVTNNGADVLVLDHDIKYSWKPQVLRKMILEVEGCAVPGWHVAVSYDRHQTVTRISVLWFCALS